MKLTTSHCHGIWSLTALNIGPVVAYVVVISIAKGEHVLARFGIQGCDQGHDDDDS